MLKYAITAGRRRADAENFNRLSVTDSVKSSSDSDRNVNAVAGQPECADSRSQTSVFSSSTTSSSSGCAFSDADLGKHSTQQTNSRMLQRYDDQNVRFAKPFTSQHVATLPHSCSLYVQTTDHARVADYGYDSMMTTSTSTGTSDSSSQTSSAGVVSFQHAPSTGEQLYRPRVAGQSDSPNGFSNSGAAVMVRQVKRAAASKPRNLAVRFGQVTLSDSDPTPTNTISRSDNSSINSNSNSNACITWLPDEVVTKILSYLDTDELCRSAATCKRWYAIVWKGDRKFWRTFKLSKPIAHGDVNRKLDVDGGLRTVARKLLLNSELQTQLLKRIVLPEAATLTDKGLHLVAKHCPALEYLDISGCQNVSNMAVLDVVSRCAGLKTLKCAGCVKLSCIYVAPPESSIPTASSSVTYLDLSECALLDDSALSIISTQQRHLQHLYLRHCARITDIGLYFVATYCTDLRSLSLCECPLVTDKAIVKITMCINRKLHYLSLVKCSLITDTAVNSLSEGCRRLTYLNLRGCELVTDASLQNVFSRLNRLRSIDVGKTQCSDAALCALTSKAELQRVGLRGCAVTDSGINMVACLLNEQLVYVNLQECPHITSNGIQCLRQQSPECLIEFTCL